MTNNPIVTFSLGVILTLAAIFGPIALGYGSVAVNGKTVLGQEVQCQ